MATKVGKALSVVDAGQTLRGPSSTATTIQDEALLGTYLLPQATMHTATLIAMHITSDKIHSLQVGCKSFEADYITGPEVDVAPKLRTDIFHSAQPLKSTSCSSSNLQPGQGRNHCGCECISPHTRKRK